jgi:hypothetical protein
VDATLKYHSTSTGAVLANDKLLSALQENRLDVDQNGRAAHDYVITWETNAELYNAQLRDPNARLMTRRSSICANTQCRYHSATRGQDIHRLAHCPRKHANRVPQYYALLLSACSTYDEANGLKNGPTEATTLRHDTAHKREVNAEGNTKYETFLS